MIGIRGTYARLNQMLDAAMDGSFEESEYSETELSKLESKWKRFLVSAQLSQEQLKKERESIQSLVSDISHQVKTPLSNILLYTQLLEEQELEEESRALAKEIKAQSRKLEFLLQSLVMASRMETGMFQFVPVKQELSKMLQEVVVGARQKAKEQKIQVCVTEPKVPISAVFDQKWTAEALGNLLDNAVKYSHAGGEVSVSVTEYEMFVRIDVRDQGLGIPEEELPLVFQRFYRGKQVLGEEGVGLGLYLARQIAEGQGGYLVAKAKPGEGSVFSMHLPKGDG